MEQSDIEMDENRAEFLDKDESRRLMTNENEMPTGGSQTLATSGKKSHPLIVHSLVIIFGISAWIGVNGIYVQLPLLVTSAPEGWNLAAYLVVIIQAANVGPAIYTISKKYFHPNESFCIFFLLLAGSSSMGLLAFFYQKTFHLGNGKHSLTLFISGFFTALVGCTSSVLFMPYLRNSREKYLVSYFIGEGLSGVLPSVVALFQGVGGNPKCVDYGNGTRIEISPEPRFSSRSYFIFIFGILLLSLCTFGLLRYLLSVETKERKCGKGSSSLMAINGQPNENSPRLESEYRGNVNDTKTMKQGQSIQSKGSSSLIINGQSEANENGPRTILSRAVETVKSGYLGNDNDTKTMKRGNVEGSKGSSRIMVINGQPEANENGPRLESGYGGNDNDTKTMKRGNVEGSNGSSRLMANNKDGTKGPKGSTSLMAINGQPEANGNGPRLESGYGGNDNETKTMKRGNVEGSKGSSSLMTINGQPQANENGPRLESGYGGNDNDTSNGSKGSSSLMAIIGQSEANENGPHPKTIDNSYGSNGSAISMAINGQPEANENGPHPETINNGYGTNLNDNDTIIRNRTNVEDSNGSSRLMAINGQPEANENGPHPRTINNNSYGSNLNDNDTIIRNGTNTEIIDNISSSRTVYLHILVGLVCFLGNGFLPGIQTYSCLPYGNVAFHMTVTLANIANPSACLLFLWLDSGNLRILDALTFVGVISCTYAIFLAAMSPVPPLRDSAIGVTFAVLTWVFLTGIISYLKLFVTSSVRRKRGPNALLGVGIVMQLGSACGALLSFGLINYTELFRQNETCAPL